MTGICHDSPRLGIVGCGATYGGEMQRSVATVPWSRYPDGKAHVTGRLSVIDVCWDKGPGEYADDSKQMADPAACGFAQDDRGIWRHPISDSDRARLAQIRSHPSTGISVGDETASGGTGVRT